MYEVKDGVYMNENQFLQALTLDRIVYPEDYWLDEFTGLQYLRAHPEIYTFVSLGGRLIAYLNMSFISRRCFKLIYSGKQSDLCIGAEDICLPIAGSVNYLYFSSVVVDPLHRRKGLSIMMFSHFAEKLKYIYKNGVSDIFMIADALSTNGEKLCCAFGMSFVKQTARGSKIYALRAVGDNMEKLISIMDIKNCI